MRRRGAPYGPLSWWAKSEFDYEGTEAHMFLCGLFVERPSRYRSFLTCEMDGKCQLGEEKGKQTTATIKAAMNTRNSRNAC